MRKLKKNFNEQRKTVEVMTGMCANNTCVCYTFDCECNGSITAQSSMNATQNYNNKVVYTKNVKHL